MPSLPEQVAVVTGASSGIGRAVAAELVDAGARVALVARDEERLRAVASEIAGSLGFASAFASDVADPDSVAACAKAVRGVMGEPSILVNCAGFASSAPLHETSDEDWQRAFAVNAAGPFHWIRELAPAMSAAGWGRIVTVASVAGRQGAPYVAAYAASKHAAVGLTRVAAAELARDGVTVNAVCPGFVDTEMTVASVDRIVRETGRTAEQARGALEALSPQRRLLEAGEVAAAVRYLCSEEAAGVNGQSIVIDGGAMQA
jgi:NAD(P)-dependent dehydrogenase (short-subunit alcohol dehydrogenase family)